MTLAVAAGFEKKAAINALLRLLKASGIDSYALIIGKGWESSAGELLDRLKRAGPILIIPDAGRGTDSWLSFLIGYCAGREQRGFILMQEPVGSITPLYKILKVFRDTDEILAFFTREKDGWKKIEKEKLARHDLVESGLGLTKENFSACVMKGNREAVGSYLNLGFSPDTENERGVPLLILSIRSKHTDITRDLISRGADVNRISVDRGNTALMEASSAGDLPLIMALLDAGADINLRSKSGQTALMLAAGEGQKEAVRELLRRGAELGIKDNLGMTAVKYAELFKHTDITEILIGTDKE